MAQCTIQYHNDKLNLTTNEQTQNSMILHGIEYATFSRYSRKVICVDTLYRVRLLQSHYTRMKKHSKDD